MTTYQNDDVGPKIFCNRHELPASLRHRAPGPGSQLDFQDFDTDLAALILNQKGSSCLARS